MLPRHPVVGVLEDVRSLYNVGSIFRTADAARLERLVLCGITGTPEHKGIHKTALGAHEVVPWRYAKSSEEALSQLKREGYHVAALELTDAPTPVSGLQAQHFPLALVVGHEVHGVTDEALALCDFAIEVPQYGVKQSLNVSVAFGVAAYALVGRAREVGGFPLPPVPHG
jgi:tRNA G18 (ribose-2'-O)-methylase SpoU